MEEIIKNKYYCKIRFTWSNGRVEEIDEFIDIGLYNVLMRKYARMHGERKDA